MSRLDIFKNNEKIERIYKSSLASLGFRPGTMPSTKEIDMAYKNKKGYLANTNLLEQSYTILNQPLYKFERIFERIQYQYLLKQYEILNKYYQKLQDGGLTKENEKILDSYENEYQECLTNIRHIETESNIVAELITGNIDIDTVNSFISNLEKREIEVNIDANLLQTRIKELKENIKQLYYKESSKKRIEIKDVYTMKIRSFNEVIKKFPNAEQVISNYLEKQSKKIIFDDIRLSERREHLSEVIFIANSFSNPKTGNSNLSKEELINKFHVLKNKLDYILKLKKIDLISLYKNNVMTIDNNDYLNNLTKAQEQNKELDRQVNLVEAYTNILEAMLNKENFSSEEISYIDGLLNSLDEYANSITTNNQKIENIDTLLAKEMNENSSLRVFKERSISENILLRYVNLKNRVISYYNDAFISIKNRTSIYQLLSSMAKLLEDNKVSLEEKVKTINYLEDFVNTYCSSNELIQKNSISK